MSHDAFRELAAGRLLDDLDPDEATALDDHLATCRPCRAELRALDETMGLVALAAPQRRPPAALRDRVFASIAGLGSVPAPLPVTFVPAAAAGVPRERPGGPDPGAPWRTRVPGGAPGPSEPRVADPSARTDPSGRPRSRAILAVPRWTGLAGLALAAVLVVAIAGLGANVAALQDRLDQATAAAATARADVAAAQAEAAAARADAQTARGQADVLVAELAAVDSAVALALAPSHRTAALTADAGVPGLRAWTVYVPGSTDAVFVARGLPPAPAGHVYQLWYADPSGVHAGATFNCAAGSTCIVPFGVDLGRAAATMVTVEPAGGSSGQPGPQVAFGELAG
jgi:Anti-sigma-K factor rskA, C-terminal/Putative zinc-finger